MPCFRNITLYFLGPPQSILMAQSLIFASDMVSCSPSVRALASLGLLPFVQQNYLMLSLFYILSLRFLFHLLRFQVIPLVCCPRWNILRLLLIVPCFINFRRLTDWRKRQPLAPRSCTSYIDMFSTISVAAGTGGGRLLVPPSK